MNARLEDLVLALGLPATLRLVERFGGVRIYIPSRKETMTAEHPLAEAIGLEAAQELCKRWPQDRPYIPRASIFLRDARDRALIADAEKLSVPQLARKYALTERGVYKTLIRARANAAKMRDPRRQATLF